MSTRACSCSGRLASVTVTALVMLKLATCCAEEGLLQAQSDLSPKHVTVLKDEGVCNLVFSHDSRRLAGSVWDTVLIWDVASQKLEASLKPHWSSMTSVVFGADANTVITASSPDKIIKIWNVRQGRVRSELRGHASRVWKLAVSPDRSMLLSSDGVRAVKLWDLKKQIELKSISLEKPGSFDRISFAPDGKTVAIAGGLGREVSWAEVRVFDVPDLRLRRTFRDLDFPVRSVVFSPDSKYLLAASDEAVYHWELASGKLLTRWSPGLNLGVHQLAFSGRGDVIVTAGHRANPANWFVPLGEARFWAIKNGEIEVRKSVGVITDIGGFDYFAVSPDGKYCATGGRYCPLRLWQWDGVSRIKK